MKKEYGTDLPILSASDNQDERASNVYLVSYDEEAKTTAEDMGLFWFVIDWEKMELGEEKQVTWFDRSGYSIDKELIEVLSQIAKDKPFPEDLKDVSEVLKRGDKILRELHQDDEDW